MLIRALKWIAIENAINSYLYLDPQTRQNLAALVPKVIQLKLTDWQLHFYIIPHEEGVHLHAIYQGPVDCIISGSSFDLLRAARRDSEEGSRVAQGIVVEGDMELGQGFQHILRDSKIDWEEYLSHLIGDAATHGLGRFLRTFKQWGKDTSEDLQRNLTDYLQREIRYLPPREEVEDFFADVRVLADDVERLSKRIQCAD